MDGATFKLVMFIFSTTISAMGIYANHRRKDIRKWLHDRRIDDKEKNEMICEDCGATMIRRTYHDGPRKGMTPLACSKYPQCRNIRWN